jgi:hypothetical protein
MSFTVTTTKNERKIFNTIKDAKTFIIGLANNISVNEFKVLTSMGSIDLLGTKIAKGKAVLQNPDIDIRSRELNDVTEIMAEH